MNGRWADRSSYVSESILGWLAEIEIMTSRYVNMTGRMVEVGLLASVLPQDLR